MRMKLKLFLMVLACFPMTLNAATRTDEARTTASRVSVTAARVTPTKSTTITSAPVVATSSVSETESASTDELIGSSGTVATLELDDVIEGIVESIVPMAPENCRDSYRACMDEFCLLSDAEGNRCSCSDSITQAKSIITEIQDIQSQAELLYTEGVEKEKLGATADLVFGDNGSSSSSSKSINFMDWMTNESAFDEYGAELGDDMLIGANLYSSAAKFCASELAACGDKAEMEELLYSRQITQDCKNYDTYLMGQKQEAENNKKIAEAAVRTARLDMLVETNLYNRGECLLAYKSCIADKGGCGVNFENCLDEDLLSRRANACENVLNQCMAVKNDVLSDWVAESEMVLADAAKYADKNRRQTCFAQIQLCLEDGCSSSSNAACLNDIDVAAGICPIIEECDELVPGIKDSVEDNLGYVRVSICQSDVDKCLQEKCGTNFNSPECLGKTSAQIAELCPKSILPGCKTETQFDVIVAAALMQMDYQMLQGCVNYFAAELGNACGADMSCLPSNPVVASMLELPDTETGLNELRNSVIDSSKAEVDEFFERFENTTTIAACQDSVKVAGQKSLQSSVFESSKIIAEIQAENRALRELDLKITELSRAETVEKAEELCYATYSPESNAKKDGNYSYITSVTFEPALRNCRVCRAQQVCEVGGMSKAAAGLQSAAGMAAAGAAAGTMITPGWGTAIGTVVGGVGGYIAGSSAGGEQEFCQQISSCEDVNM